jgi:hypothetical protein
VLSDPRHRKSHLETALTTHVSMLIRRCRETNLRKIERLFGIGAYERCKPVLLRMSRSDKDLTFMVAIIIGCHAGPIFWVGTIESLRIRIETSAMMDQQDRLDAATANYP